MFSAKKVNSKLQHQITRIQSQLVNERNVSIKLSNRVANILEAAITVSDVLNVMKKEITYLKEKRIIRPFANLCHRLEPTKILLMRIHTFSLASNTDKSMFTT